MKRTWSARHARRGGGGGGGGGKEGAANVTRYVSEANARRAPSSPDLRCSSSFELWLEK